MRYCVIGSTGLLGQALIKESKKRGLDIVGIARTDADFDIDITNDSELEQFLQKNRFDVVINTVAIVNHKICDDFPEKAYIVNARPSAILAELSKMLGFKYVYISTDGYFSGDKNKKHNENSPVEFFNEYARTKYCGERFALTNPNSLITRTNIVGFKGADVPTFFEWALNAVKNQDEMTLFDDYFTSSISVAQFSSALFDLINKNATGLYNVASSEVSSKKQFIEKMAEVFGLDLKNAKTGSVASLNSKRADSLGLDVTKAESLLGYKLPDLKEVLTKLKEEYNELQK
ncbi:SDR family oxidoreductase [bacterium]|nr:SDR family oxidoreductase [bacterium]